MCQERNRHTCVYLKAFEQGRIFITVMNIPYWFAPLRFGSPLICSHYNVTPKFLFLLNCFLGFFVVVVVVLGFVVFWVFGFFLISA